MQRKLCWAAKSSLSSHCSMWNPSPFVHWLRQNWVRIAARTPAALPGPDQRGPHSLSEVRSPPETGEDIHGTETQLSIKEESLKQSCISTYVQISASCSIPHRQQRQYRNNSPFQRCRGHPHHPRTDRPAPRRLLTAPPSGRQGLCARLLSSEQAPWKEAQTVKWETSLCFFPCQSACILPENGTHLLRNNVPLP